MDMFANFIQTLKSMNKSAAPNNLAYLFTFVFFVLSFISTFGQFSVSTTGGHIKSTGGSTSFTIGQVAFILKKGNGSYLNEGVQQVYTKKTTPIEDLVYLKEVHIYPNPTQETFTIIMATKEDVMVRYTIMDYLGKEIRNGNILSEKSEISLVDLPSGNYFISLKSKKDIRFTDYQLHIIDRTQYFKIEGSNELLVVKSINVLKLEMQNKK
jgi:hypothetical protein